MFQIICYSNNETKIFLSVAQEIQIMKAPTIDYWGSLAFLLLPPWPSAWSLNIPVFRLWGLFNQSLLKKGIIA